MNENQNNLAALAGLAHRALNGGDTEYARNKALIAQFFSPACAAAHKEEVRLTLIDSLYSTNVAARRLFGISSLAQSLRAAFKGGGAGLKEQTARWIAGGFDNANANDKPLYDLFAAHYGVNKDGGEGKAAVSLLSKYLYFATGYAFPIYDALGAKYFFIAQKRTPRHFQKRFRVLREIMDENRIDGFDKLDNLLWLYGKVQKGSLSLVLNEAQYTALNNYRGNKTIADSINRIRAGKDAAPLQKIFGADLYKFIQKTAHWGKAVQC